MQDLTAQVYKRGPIEALVPTSQAGGNRFSDRDGAMSAPMPNSTAAAVEAAEQVYPYTQSLTHERNTVTNASGQRQSHKESQAWTPTVEVEQASKVSP